MIKFSVVIPIYNEEKAIALLYPALKKVMDGMGQSYEVIFINDGSTDRSLEVLKTLDLRPANLVIVNLDKHRGQSATLQAGFDVAQGTLIITMDGDLQNDPIDIPALLNKMKNGYDVVCGWRYDRKDPWTKLLSSRIANDLRRIVTKEKIHDVGCTLRVFKRECLKGIYLSGSMHRFFTLIMFRLGYNIGETKVKHHPRKFGRTKYNISNRLLKGLVDLVRILLFDIYTLIKRRPVYETREIIRI